MSLRLIYGKAGTGKSQYCFNQIKEKINSGNPIYVIVPEQFSYTAEKKLLETLESSSSVNAEVISFKRMADRIFTEVGGRTKTNLTEAGKAMLVSNILEEKKKDLKFLGRNSNNIDLMLRTITEMKKHCIDEKNFEDAIEKVNTAYLKMKIEDISTIYMEYQNKIISKYIDEDDVLSLLGSKLDDSKMFENSYIFIDEFSGFTQQEYVIIEKLLKKANEVNITVCIDELEEVITSENDIYYPNKLVALKLIQSAKLVDCEVQKPIKLENRFKFKSKELSFIEENIYAFPYKIYNEEVKNVELFLAMNPYSEIENVANQIVKLVRDEKLEYRDIGIIAKNIDEYSSIAKAIFSKYDIPVFIDEKSELSQNILIKYILSILDIFAKNWSHEAVFNYIKTGLSISSDYSKQEIYKLENYCLKWGIRGKTWYKEDWKYGVENTDIEKLNQMRRKVVEPLISLKNEIDKEKTAGEITKQIYRFLEKNEINEKLKDKINRAQEIENKQIESEYTASWNILMDILDEILLVFDNEKITFDKYINLLKTGLQYSSLGQIPKTIDEVTMGDVNRSKSSKIKAAFIIGINDGIFPSVNRQEGFLNDKDRSNLKEIGIELAKGTIENLYDEQFNIYRAFTSAEEKLYLSYVSSDTTGKAKRPSTLIIRVKKIFTGLKEKSDIINKEIEINNAKSTFTELLSNLQKLKAGEKIDSKWIEIYAWYLNNSEWKERLENALKAIEYNNSPEKLNKENVDKLYGEVLKTSISRLEQFNECPFSFFLKYGLKLKEQEKLNIKPIDTGSFMHDVINEYFDRIKGQNIESITEEDIEKIVNSIINEKLNLNKNYIFNSTPKFVALTVRLKNVISQSIKYIVYQLQNSDFNVLGTEVEFKKNLDNVQLEGKIDRIDIAENGEDKFIRVIDYKSSNHDINLNELMAGVQIQLLTYIDAVSKEKVPAGMLYFKLIDPITKSSKNLTEEEIEERIRKEFKMRGLILADIQVVKMMDKNLEQGSSDKVPVYVNSKGEISASKSDVITKEQFSQLQKSLEKIINKTAKEILSGNIDIKPVYNKANKKSQCEYCEYKSICNFDSNKNQCSYIQKRTREQILSELESK